jgi:hypothetical protein
MQNFVVAAESSLDTVAEESRVRLRIVRTFVFGAAESPETTDLYTSDIEINAKDVVAIIGKLPDIGRPGCLPQLRDSGAYA